MKTKLIWPITTTENRQPTNQNSKQRHAVCAKCGKTRKPLKGSAIDWWKKIRALTGYGRLREIRFNQSHAELQQTHENNCKLRIINFD